MVNGYCQLIHCVCIAGFRQTLSTSWALQNRSNFAKCPIYPILLNCYNFLVFLYFYHYVLFLALNRKSKLIKKNVFHSLNCPGWIQVLLLWTTKPYILLQEIICSSWRTLILHATKMIGALFETHCPRINA